MQGPSGKHPTIHDVAGRAGVSKSLVSLVMRGAPNVSDKKRAAVLAAAEDLGYRPNAVARSLVRQRTGVIGCVLSDLHNPFFADVADGIEEGAVSGGYRVLLSSGFLDEDRESTAVDTLLQLRVDGLVLIGSVSPDTAFTRHATKVPVVMVSRPTTLDVLDAVTNDDEAGVIALVEHLVGLGHRHITHISGGAGAGASARRRGYEAAMRRAGLAAAINVVEGSFTEMGGRLGMETILSGGDLPTAVLAPNDFAAFGALAAVDAAGLAVPDDLSLAGYDGLTLSRLGRIDLTTVAQPAAAMGHRATRLLIERIEGTRTEPTHEVLAPRLVVGSTTGPPRAS